MIENLNEIEIQAPAEQVWQVLTDLEKFVDWNPLFCKGVGKVELGEKVEVTAKSANKDRILECEVVKVEPTREFAWKFYVIHPFLFRAVHIFQIEPISEQRVRFIDREAFEGLLLPLQAKDIETTGLAAMVEMGKALKKRVE